MDPITKNIRSHTTILTLLSFIGGIALGPIQNIYTILIAIMSIILLCRFLTQSPRNTIIIILCLIIGIIRVSTAQHTISQENIDSLNDTNRKIKIQGTICEEPDRRTTNIKLTLCVESLLSPEKRDISGRVLINTKRYPDYNYGEQIEVRGMIETPGEFDSFSYKNYLDRYHIHSIIYNPSIKKIGYKKINPLFKGLFQFKLNFENKINEIYPEPYGSFLAGLLLGSRKGIPKELTEEFNTTGLTHIVAISGYNITILIAIVMALVRPYGKRLSIYASGAVIILFTVIVGMSAAVVRACIMGIISLIAISNARQTNIHILLLLTVSIMLAINPKILYFDVGFQLSFLATVGLIYISPLLENFTKKIPNALGIKESFLLTISAQIAATPIIVLNFERLSMIAPISNMLIGGPIIPFSMLFGFIATIIGYVSITLAKIIGFITYLLLSYVIQIVHITAKIPYASVDIIWFNKILLLGYYIGLIALLRWLWKRNIDTKTQEACSLPSNQQ